MNNNDKSTPFFEWTLKIFMIFYFAFIFFLNEWNLKDGTSNSFEYVGVGFFAALGLTCTLACLYQLANGKCWTDKEKTTLTSKYIVINVFMELSASFWVMPAIVFRKFDSYEFFDIIVLLALIALNFFYLKRNIATWKRAKAKHLKSNSEE